LNAVVRMLRHQMPLERLSLKPTARRMIRHHARCLPRGADERSVLRSIYRHELDYVRVRMSGHAEAAKLRPLTEHELGERADSLRKRAYLKRALARIRR
jgi:hypothetical protein